MSRSAVVFALSICGCVAPERAWASTFVPVDQSAWREARSEVDRLRKTVPEGPRVEQVRVGFRGPAGIGFEGRGAIAVLPGRALRMILVGPAGRTALDVWATRDRYRLSVPELDVVERGGVDAPKHLPIALFREWFLDPLGGRLLAAGSIGNDRLYLVRGASQTLELTSRGDRFELRKYDALGDEVVTWNAPAHALMPGVGSRVVFRKPKSAIEVTVVVEEIGQEPPSAEAFDEPSDEVQR